MAEEIGLKIHTKREARRLVRFVLVGGSSFFIHAGSYFVISRFIWISGDRLLIQVVSLGFAVTYNFFAHRRWTYKSNGLLRAQLFRYGVVVLAASGIQTGVFWAAFNLFGIYDLLSIVLASGVSAIFTFVAHRLFTFREKPEDMPIFPDVI